MITAPVFWMIKVAAALGGAVLGYVISGPAIRLLYRLAFQRPVPGWLLPLGKLGGAALIGALFFLLATLGGNGLGWGGSGGAGGGPGPGGIIPSTGDKGKPGKGGGEKATREKLVIELLGGNRIIGDGRFYLIQGAEPPKTLGEIEDILKERAAKLEVHVRLTDDSVAASHPAVGRLRELLQRYQVPTTEK